MAKEREIDHQLVLRAQGGEKLAFGLLVTKYQRKLFRLAFRMLGNQAEAEDVVQETFIKAYRALPQFRSDSAFYTWLYRIAVNAARTSLESRGKRLPELYGTKTENDETFNTDEYLTDTDTPETLLSSKQIAHTVNLALEELPQDLRMALSLREVDGLSYDQIAELMECPIGTVRSRIFRAREAIAEKIQPLMDAGTKKSRAILIPYRKQGNDCFVITSKRKW